MYIMVVIAISEIGSFRVGELYSLIVIMLYFHIHSKDFCTSMSYDQIQNTSVVRQWVIDTLVLYDSEFWLKSIKNLTQIC